MALFEWTTEHSVSVLRFDNDHKKLFSLINELNDAMSERRGRFVVVRVLQELADYARWHFDGEESAMHRAKFAGVEEHIAEHREFAAKVELLYAQCGDSYSTAPIEVLYFLRDWLLHHILVIDRQYAAPLNSAGIH
jgi:hemerythrin-like metal-binding protein